MNARAARSAWLALALARLLSGGSVSAEPRVIEGAKAREGGRFEERALAIGETITLSAKDVRNYSVSLPNVIDTRITPDASEFVIVGKQPGNTTLLLINGDNTRSAYSITVTARPDSEVKRDLEQLLEGISGVQARHIGSRYFLEGSVGTDGELQRLHQLAGLYPGQVENLVTVGGGTASDRNLLIRIDFFFVQYDKSSSYGVGLAWPESIGGTNVATSQFSYDFVAGITTTAQASIINQPLPRLDIAARRGWAKVMRQASMLTSNGMEANFDSGGEQNFTVSTGLALGLQSVTFGTVVRILPRYDAKTQQLQLKIVSDISDLTPGVQSNVPGRSFSRLTTNVALKLGQGLVLSGLRSRSQTHSVGGLPVLSQIPILGLLFASHSDTKSETENAMFIIPSVVETVPRPALSLIESVLQGYEEYSGDIRGVKTYEHTPPSAR